MIGHPRSIDMPSAIKHRDRRNRDCYGHGCRQIKSSLENLIAVPLAWAFFILLRRFSKLKSHNIAKIASLNPG